MAAGSGGGGLSLDAYIIGFFLIVFGCLYVIHISLPIYEIATVKIRYAHLSAYRVVFKDIDNYNLYKNANTYINNSKLTKIDRALLRKVIQAKPKAISYTEVFYLLLFVIISIKLFFSARKVKSMLFLNPVIQSPPTGVEGFIKIIEGFVEKQLIDKVREFPTPNTLYNVMTVARKRANIPPNWVARCFPKNSEERLRLLEWGKQKVIERQSTANKTKELS